MMLKDQDESKCQFIKNVKGGVLIEEIWELNESFVIFKKL